jgi:DtxR family Mn-dependent transcriptional regulator
MVHPQLLDHPLEEVLEQIWCRLEEGDNRIEGLLEQSGEPSAGELLDRLSEKGLVQLDDERVHLTTTGEARARALVRNHRLAERLLADVLDVPLNESEKAACLMEHILSPAVTDAVCAFLGHPPTCPHGQVIPPGPCCAHRENGVLKPVVIPLGDLEPGREARIIFMAPSVTRRLDRLGSFGLVPGTVLTLRQKRPSFVVEIGGTTLALEEEVASEIFVRREP